MKNIKVAFSCEVLKVYRSKIFWITILTFSIIPFIGEFFIFILKDPEFARSSGLIGAKAQLTGSADWPTYFQLLSQAISIGGLLVFGFVTSWVFGREIPRIQIVLSIIVFLWCMFFSLFVYLLLV